MEIKPWITAIKRKDMSMPMKKLIELKYLKINNSILDYGCGYGKDIEILKNNGFKISGYDKYIKTFSNELVLNKTYDIISCFYVLNVISDNKERINVIKNIYNHLNNNGISFICVRSNKEFKQIKYVHSIKYNDGIITKKLTFQKFFTKDDFEKLIKEAIPNAKLSFIPCDNRTLFIKVEKNIV